MDASSAAAVAVTSLLLTDASGAGQVCAPASVPQVEDPHHLEHLLLTEPETAPVLSAGFRLPSRQSLARALALLALIAKFLRAPPPLPLLTTTPTPITCSIHLGNHRRKAEVRICLSPAAALDHSVSFPFKISPSLPLSLIPSIPASLPSQAEREARRHRRYRSSTPRAAARVYKAAPEHPDLQVEQ